MSLKLSLTVGEDAKGNIRQLYLGRDAGEAKRIHGEAISGLVKDVVRAGFALNLRLERSRDVQTQANHGVLNLKGAPVAPAPAPATAAKPKK